MLSLGGINTILVNTKGFIVKLACKSVITQTHPKGELSEGTEGYDFKDVAGQYETLDGEDNLKKYGN